MPSPHRMAVLALEGVAPFDLGVAVQIFCATYDGEGRPLYELLVCTPDGNPVRSGRGFGVLPDHGIEALAEADTVVVPGVYGDALDNDPAPDLLDALRSAAGRARVVSICTGAFVLAAAGLLDGRAATTHWFHAERFRRRFPAVRLDPNVLFVDDGDILTSAGVGAGIDLCLHVIRGDHGSEVANRTARRCVVAPWRDGGQAQFIEHPLGTVPDASTAHVRAWALEHLDEPLDLRSLARRARMSVRTFTRRFRRETGMSVGQWLSQQRIERARHLLESTDLSIAQVAARCGFGTAASLRQHLRATLGVAPSTYRRTFSPPTDPTPLSFPGMPPR